MRDSTSKDKMKETLAVIGAKSMIASQFCQQAEGEFALIRADLPEIDITKKDLVENFFKHNSFQWAILFSAITDVTGSEKERDNKNGPTWQVNVDGTRNVAQMCKIYSRGLIFFSTDFVFDGTNGPYSEDDPTGPDLKKISWYGITKIEGEKIVAQVTSHIILRISYPYSGKDTGKEDLFLRIVKRYERGELYPMYTDQTITPTYIGDIEPALKLLFARQARGIIHLASPQPVTQYDFARYAIDESKIKGPKSLETKSILEDHKNENFVPRPQNSGLMVDKIRSLGFEPTGWQQGIDKSINLWIK